MGASRGLVGLGEGVSGSGARILCWVGEGIMDAKGGRSEALEHEATRAKLKAALASTTDAEARFRCLAAILQHRARDLREFLSFALQQAMELTRSRLGFLHCADPRHPSLLVSAPTGGDVSCCVRQDLVHGCLCGEAMRRGRPVMENDFCAWESGEGGRPEGCLASSRCMAVPVTVEGRTVAAVGVADKPAAYEPEDAEHLRLLLDAAWKVVERRQAEEALARSLELLRETGRLAHVGGWDCDVPTRQLTWTEGARDVYGVDADFVPTPDSCLQFFPPQSRPLMEAAWEAARTRGTPFDLEVEFVTARGASRMVHIIGKVELENGAVTRVHGTIQDITERCHWQQRLRQSEKMDAIGQLASGVAHDFNNQLTAILGFADILSELVPDETLRLYARQIKTASMRAADLTGRLLSFTRVGGGTRVAVDVHRILQEAVSILEHTVDRRIRVRHELLAPYHMVLGDPTQLQNAFLNLGVNARDAMPGGGELVFATSVVIQPEEPRHAVLQPGRHVEVRISDTGTGMDDHVRQRIFEPFFTTKGVGKGTGLGLAAVDSTVRSHGGTVAVESEVGRGTMFRVLLPVLEKPEEQRASDALPVRGTGHVLVVDDEPLIRELAAEMLVSLGYRVTSFPDGADARDYYEGAWREVDLVILDMVMPRLSGRDTHASMRLINPGVKVLFMSGHCQDDDVAETLSATGVAFVQKPFTKAILSRQVAEALK